MRRDDFILKLINLLITELENCSLGGNFRVSRHAGICQFDRFSSEINFKRARSCNHGIPRLVQAKMKILYLKGLCRKRKLMVEFYFVPVPDPTLLDEKAEVRMCEVSGKCNCKKSAKWQDVFSERKIFLHLV